MHTNRSGLEVVRPEEVEHFWLHGQCQGERRGQCSLLALTSSEVHLSWESCRMAETLLWHLSGPG